MTLSNMIRLNSHNLHNLIHSVRFDSNQSTSNQVLLLNSIKTLSRPYDDLWARATDPVGYYKWQVNRIDQCRTIYEKCSKQFDINPNLYKSLGLKYNFNTWFASTVLHIWMINCRLRAEGQEGKEVTQGINKFITVLEIFDHIWTDVEIKLFEHGIKTKYKRIFQDLLESYYGQILAYDEGLAKGDSILASALWRFYLFINNLEISIIKAKI